MTVGDVPGPARAAIPGDVLTWASRPGPAAVLARARDRIEGGHRGPAVLVSSSPLTAQERADLGRLLGLEWQTSGRPVRLGPLRRALTRSGVELERLLEFPDRPLRDRPAEKVAEGHARAAAVARVHATLVRAGVADEVATRALAERWLGPADQATEVAAEVAAVLRRLPAPAGTLLGELATEVLGNPHALDRHHRLGRAVLRLHLTSTGVLTGAERVAEPEVWRSTWAAAGVTCDRLSSLVLVLNLPLPASAGPAAELCAAVPGEPVWLTLRTIPPGFTLPAAGLAGLTVRVCENPSVVEAAADRLGVRARPLVCTYGQLSVTGLALLRALGSAGAELLVSGDRDAPGLVITAGILREVPTARPWLPEVPGLYEEDRIGALVVDLAG